MKRFFRIWFGTAGIGILIVAFAGGMTLVDKHPLIGISLLFLSIVTAITILIWSMEQM